MRVACDIHCGDAKSVFETGKDSDLLILMSPKLANELRVVRQVRRPNNVERLVA